MPRTLAAALLIIYALIIGGQCLPEPVYTVHYVRSYRRDLVDSYFGCGKAIVYGTFLHPMGAVDALYALMNPHVYGINANCQRKDTYIKLFGEAQDYAELIKLGEQMHTLIENAVGRLGSRKAVLEWKYLPKEADKQEQAKKALGSLVSGLKSKGFSVFLKAPASYFCLNVAGSRYILDQPADNFIAEIYGEQPGMYTTYESIFGTTSAGPQGAEGYSLNCPKYPTLSQMSAGDKKVFLEKTLDPSLAGYIGSHFQEFLQKAGENAFKGVYFYDGFPLQTVEL